MRWRTVTALAFGIMTSLLAAEIGSTLIYDTPVKRQAHDGIHDLVNTPNILAVSSSHGRSFHILGNELARRTHGELRLVAVPLEAGKVHAMEWLLRNRLAPLLLDNSHQIKKPLSHVIFGVTWWDTCRENTPASTAQNVVTHGWRFNDYFHHVKSNGITELNRNYVRNAWRRLFSSSNLVRARFAISENFSRFTNFLRVILSGTIQPTEYKETLTRWQLEVEEGHTCFLSDFDMDAMDRFVDFTKDHNLDLTIVLFPLKPDTITEAGFNNTILPFTRAIEAYGQDKAVRIIDMTLGSLVDEDFMLDLDHVNFEGNVKWSTHALNNELAYLLDHLPSGELE